MESDRTDTNKNTRHTGAGTPESENPVTSKEYETMLKKAMEKLPKKSDEEKRFEIPQIVSMTQGNKTIIRNFGEILSVLRREGKHLAKFFFKQLATPGNIEGNTLVLQRKVNRSLLQRKLEDYIKEYVYCKVCGEPDTLLRKEDRITFMRCEACGARSSVREI
jgi:translation initiation factor 2 subunit 2